MQVDGDGSVAPSHGATVEESIVERLCRWVCEITLVAMVVLTSVEVLLRPFYISLGFADEIGGYLLVALTFLSLPVALIGRAFHQVEFIHGHIGPRARALTEIAFFGLSLIFAVLLNWQLIRLVWRSYQSSVVAPTLFAAPVWIPQSAMVIGVSCLIVALCRMIYRNSIVLAGNGGGRHV